MNSAITLQVNITFAFHVTPNIFSAHHDPNTWPEPEKFDPSRHIDENGKFVFSQKIIPFSTGGRSCLGESISRMEMFLIFTGMLQKFTVTAGTHPLPTLDQGYSSLIYSPPKLFYCNIKTSLNV
ncbi:unnamed protein product [Clavelina lepadiformis]|uniref:Cytochrome P450 n=1 Tax=Clavelina lepadiformis TaxID=159417 RepID=A0ABP0F7X0_CLALP